MNNDKDNVSGYQDYLDKEMTIMGILSTFCIVSLGFGVDRLVLPVNKGEIITWTGTPSLCLIGLGGILMAALAFYRQRALLAWYYGQISLYKAKGDNTKIQELLDDSDKWKSWVFYQSGFGFLFIGISEISWLLLSNKYSTVEKHLDTYAVITLFFWLILYTLKIISYIKFSSSDEPEIDLFRLVIKKRNNSESKTRKEKKRKASGA